MSKRIIFLVMFLFLVSKLVVNVFSAELSKSNIDVYGFIKLDTSLDSSITDNPDAPKYVRSEDETQFAMTAMNTRIGVDFSGTKTKWGEVVGKVEIDFYDTSSDNSQKPRMRHAYFELKNEKTSLLAGQTWDVFGPLGTNSLNTNGWLWNGGNIGFRRPQIRFTKYSTDKKFITQISINRNIGGETVVGVNSGENSGVPLFEARVAYDFLFNDKTSTIGVEVLYGKEKHSLPWGDFTVSQEAFGLDLILPLSTKTLLKGELFSGSNLDAFLAGVGQGVNLGKEEAIDTVGGWLQFTYTPNDKYDVNICYGIDNPDDDDSYIYKNQVFFINVIHPIAKNVKVGAEYSNFKTEYFNEDMTNNRLMASLIYSL